MKASEFWPRLVLWAALPSLALASVRARAPGAAAAPPAERTVVCDATHAQRVRVAMRRLTTLSFPVVPKEIIPGENSFDFQRVGNDLNIKPLRAGAATNILVYMAERRCAFDLAAVEGAGDGILVVRDAEDKQFEVEFK